jgi:hypothetical protein
VVDESQPVTGVVAAALVVQRCWSRTTSAARIDNSSTASGPNPTDERVKP